MPPINLIFSSDVIAKAQAGHSKEMRLTTSATLMGCSQMPSSLNGTGRPESICHKRTHPARFGISAQRTAVFLSGRQLQQFLEMCTERLQDTRPWGVRAYVLAKMWTALYSP